MQATTAPMPRLTIVNSMSSRIVRIMFFSLGWAVFSGAFVLQIYIAVPVPDAASALDRIETPDPV